MTLHDKTDKRRTLDHGDMTSSYSDAHDRQEELTATWMNVNLPTLLTMTTCFVSRFVADIEKQFAHCLPGSCFTQVYVCLHKRVFTSATCTSDNARGNFLNSMQLPLKP